MLGTAPLFSYVINLHTLSFLAEGPLALTLFFPLSSRGFFGAKLHCRIVLLTTLHSHALCTYVVVGAKKGFLLIYSLTQNLTGIIFVTTS